MHSRRYFSSSITNEICETIFLRFSPKHSSCKDGLFSTPNMAPSRELLFNSSFLISINLKGLCQISSFFVYFNKFNFQMRFFSDVLYLQQSRIQKKSFNMGPASTVHFLLEYQRPMSFYIKNDIVLPDY